MASGSVSRDIDQALGTLIGQSFGKTTVRDVSVQLDVDQDNEPVMRVAVALSPPEDPEGTWPFSDVDAIRRAARRLTMSVEDDEGPYAAVELRHDDEAAGLEPERSETDLAEGLRRADESR